LILFIPASLPDFMGLSFLMGYSFDQIPSFLFPVIFAALPSNTSFFNFLSFDVIIGVRGREL